MWHTRHLLRLFTVLATHLVLRGAMGEEKKNYCAWNCRDHTKELACGTPIQVVSCEQHLNGTTTITCTEPCRVKHLDQWQCSTHFCPNPSAGSASWFEEIAEGLGQSYKQVIELPGLNYAVYVFQIVLGVFMGCLGYRLRPFSFMIFGVMLFYQLTYAITWVETSTEQETLPLWTIIVFGIVGGVAGLLMARYLWLGAGVMGGVTVSVLCCMLTNWAGNTDITLGVVVALVAFVLGGALFAWRRSAEYGVIFNTGIWGAVMLATGLGGFWGQDIIQFTENIIHSYTFDATAILAVLLLPACWLFQVCLYKRSQLKERGSRPYGSSGARSQPLINESYEEVPYSQFPASTWGSKKSSRGSRPSRPSI